MKCLRRVCKRLNSKHLGLRSQIELKPLIYFFVAGVLCAQAMCGVALGVALGACICCCCVLPAIVGGAVWVVLGPVIQASVQIAMCVNKTVGAKQESFFASLDNSGPCYDLKSMECDEKNPSDECKILQTKCSCLIAEHLAEANNPSLDDGLQQCCSEVVDAAEELQEKYPKLNISQIASSIFKVNGTVGEQCETIVHQTTGKLEEFAEVCEKAQAHNQSIIFDADGMDTDGDFDFQAFMKSNLTNMVITKFDAFDRIVYEYASGPNIGSSALAVGGFAISLISTAVLIAVRRGRWQGPPETETLLESAE